MSVGLCILEKDTDVALLQDSMNVEGMTIEQFCRWITKKWDLHSIFLVNDGTEVLDLHQEDNDILLTDIYNTYEFDRGMSELWIEVKVKVKVNSNRAVLENAVSK